MRNNILLFTDSYKFSHYKQYPEGTKFVSSYIESRGGMYDKTLFFGLQMFLKEYFSKPFSLEDIEEYDELCRAHGFEPNTNDWLAIYNKYNGYLPVEIQAVKEGTVVDGKNVLVQIKNTDPNYPWLTSYLETCILQAIWYPVTVATRSWTIKQKIKAALEKTSDNAAAVLPFRLHDFGERGVSSRESAGIGGCAHLVNFMGTDTVEGLRYARRYYGEMMAGYSIPATEHSVSTSYGPGKGEYDYVDRILTNLENAPNGSLHAIVADTYDVYNFCENILGGDTFRDRIKALAEKNKVLVPRPDSGDPILVPVKVIEILGEKFGYTVNSKGFKVLHHAVRVIQGDGMNDESVEILFCNLIVKGWSLENIAFGMGGKLLQGLDRDTLKFAMKCSAVKGEHDYDWRPAFKDPITDKGKKSKKGRLGLVMKEGKYITVSEVEAGKNNLLEVVYRDGKLLRNQSFTEIRAISNS
jgi:nicotinamide phosphoribosyltransferase